jgi:pyrophosphatase PpaX
MSSPRWPVVLFDFDGTLGDTIPLIVASYRHALETVAGLRADEGEVRSWIGRPLLAVLEERYPAHAEEMLRVYREWNLANHDDLIRPVEGIEELLADLAAAGARLGVVSSKKAETVELGLRVPGLDDAIPLVAGQDQTSRHKPHPEPLLYAARHLGAHVRECVYIGDATVDLEAARSAGMAAVGVTWGAGLREPLAAVDPVAVVDDAHGLREVLLPASAASRPSPGF